MCGEAIKWSLSGSTMFSLVIVLLKPGGKGGIYCIDISFRCIKEKSGTDGSEESLNFSLTLGHVWGCMDQGNANG